MNTTEQNLLNTADTIAQVAGQLASANNPAYAPLIAMGEAFIDAINQVVNPAAPAAATAISTAATDIAAGVTPVVQAVLTVQSGAATATQKATALGTLVQKVETLAGDVFSIFHHPAPAPTP